MTSGIYMLLNLIDGKYYVGQTFNFDIRWKDHIYLLNKNIHDNNHLQLAWNKYGINNFKFYVLEWTTSDKIILNEREQYWLDRSKCYERGIGYNVSKIAQNPMRGRKHSEETKLKMSLAKIGKLKSEETKLKMSLSKKGIKRSEATILKMSLSAKGKICSEETRIKLSNAGKGKKRPHTEETKKKLSVAGKGRRHTEEARKKISLAASSISEETRLKMSKSQKERQKR